ncbi:MAG: FAD:protein FMN transferase [Treponema sp.]|nr:FAD:protein FMN transferase [Candidatus Treponema merdequi]
MKEMLKKNKIKKSESVFCLLLLLSAVCFMSCSDQKKIKPQTEFVFGTVCTINLFENGTENLYQEIFALLNSIEQKFSVNISNSEISLINRNAAKNKVEVSEEVYSLVKFSSEVAELTDNVFNPALGSLIKLWSIGTEKQRVPEKTEIDSVLKYCNPENIVFEKSGDRFYIFLTEEKTQLDLGGIVKGYASDKICELLKKKNVNRALIDLGGNIYVFGKKSEKPGEENWRVGIKNPDDRFSEPIKIVSVNSTSVVTSGNYERFFISDGIRYHHILDSKTGFPVQNGISGVTVISENSTVCDVLSTTLFAGGIELAEKLKKIEIFGNFCAIFISFDGKITEL